jgi:hypothetical protein
MSGPFLKHNNPVAIPLNENEGGAGESAVALSAIVQSGNRTLVPVAAPIAFQPWIARDLGLY